MISAPKLTDRLYSCFEDDELSLTLKPDDVRISNCGIFLDLILHLHDDCRLVQAGEFLDRLDKLMNNSTSVRPLAHSRLLFTTPSHFLFLDPFAQCSRSNGRIDNCTQIARTPIAMP